MKRPPSAIIGGVARPLPRVRIVRHRTVRALCMAFFQGMGVRRPEDIQEYPEMRETIRRDGVWAFVATRSSPPVINYWAARDADPLHVAYVLGHEVGHISGKRLRSRRNEWREEARADEYGAAAFLAMRHVLRRGQKARRR